MDQTYQQEIETWRRSLDESLRRENSWLALAGLFWLKPGVNLLGSGPDCAIKLPPGSAPEVVGELVFKDGETTLHITADIPVRVDGVTVTQAELQSDAAGKPSIVEFGALRLIVIQRGPRFAVRLWDNDRPERQIFPGRIWYPVKETYRLEAEFTPHKEPVQLSLPSASGVWQQIASPGSVHFVLNEEACHLQALEGPLDGLFLIFQDVTNEHETYPGGRYLTTEPPTNDRVVLDFNRAYNPPCAFTRYATCALPPVENQLRVLIEAGERYRHQPE